MKEESGASVTGCSTPESTWKLILAVRQCQLGLCGYVAVLVFAAGGECACQTKPGSI